MENGLYTPNPDPFLAKATTFTLCISYFIVLA